MNTLSVTNISLDDYKKMRAKADYYQALSRLLYGEKLGLSPLQRLKEDVEETRKVYSDLIGLNIPEK